MRLARLITAWCVLMSLAAYAQQSAPASPDPSPRQTRTAEKFYVLGVRAMEKGDVEAAEKAFAKASKADPSNPDYALDWQIARQHSVTKLIQDADKAQAPGPA